MHQVTSLATCDPEDCGVRSQVLRRFHDLVLACRTLTVPDAPELPVEVPACASEAGRLECTCGAKAVVELLENSVTDAALRMRQRAGNERRRLRRACAAAQRAAGGWLSPPTGPGAGVGAPLCLSPLPARPATAAAWAALLARATATGCAALASDVLAGFGGGVTGEQREAWRTQRGPRNETVEAIVAMLARVPSDWRALMEAGEGSSSGCSCCEGSGSGGSSMDTTDRFDDVSWSPADGGRGGGGGGSSGSSSCGMPGLFGDAPWGPAGGGSGGDSSSSSLSSSSSTCGLSGLFDDEAWSPADGGGGGGGGSGSRSEPTPSGSPSTGVGDHSPISNEVQQGGDQCRGHEGCREAADSCSRESVFALSDSFESSGAGSDCASCPSTEHGADRWPACTESAAAERAALSELPVASQVRPMTAGMRSADLEGAKLTPTQRRPLCDFTRPVAACARLADLASGALRAGDGAAWLAAWALALLAGADAPPGPAAIPGAVVFSLWPLLWAAGVAGGGAGAMRCLGAAATLASMPAFAAAPPLARTLAALMAAEGLQGLALWAPGTSGMCHRSVAPSEAARSDASRAAGLSGVRFRAVSLTRVLCLVLRKCSARAALGELCAALFARAAAFTVLDNGARQLAIAAGERRAAARLAATPAEALAESLAAFDGRDLPGGAVLLAQEAPLRVRT